MHAGRITGHFHREEAEEEPILACAMGQATNLGYPTVFNPGGSLIED
jgi:hypothetical protein